MRPFLNTGIVVLLAAFLVICLFFDQPLELIATNAIITPIAFVAAAFANATAVGGGFLFVPLFIYAYGLAPPIALKLALATQAFGMTSGALGWGRNLIEKNAFFSGAVFSLLGFWLGSYTLQLPAEEVKPVFGWVSIFIFLMVVLEMKYGSKATGSSIRLAPNIKCIGYLIVTFFGGIVTAWTAIAIGEFVAVYLLFVYRLRLEMAIATGVALLAINSIAGLFFHIDLGGIRWDLLVFTVPGVVLGGFFGARVGRHLEQNVFQIGDVSKGKNMLLANSPLKILFLAIILVDGSVILIHSYIFGGV